MRMQETARDVAMIEGLVHVVCRHHQRQWQVTAADAFGQAQEIRPDVGLLAREETAGTATADGDLVGNQVHMEFIAQRAQRCQVARCIHPHADCALYQRFDDDCGQPVRATLEQGAHRL